MRLLLTSRIECIMKWPLWLVEKKGMGRTRGFSLHGGGEAMVALQSFAEGLGWLGQPEYKPDG